METKTKNTFKAVDFIRQGRNELSELYRSDKESYHKELKKTMADFLSTGALSAASRVSKESFTPSSSQNRM